MLTLAATLLVANGTSATAATPIAFTVSGQPQELRPIASNFLGLALEYRAIPQLVGPDRHTVNPIFLQLLKNWVPSGQPVLRIGGQSADRSWWPVPGYAREPGVTYDLTQDWIANARAVTIAADAKLILGLTLEANRPRLDAVEAEHLKDGLGANRIAAFEIGNEPELYRVIPWYRTLNGKQLPWYGTIGNPVYSRAPGWGPLTFAQQFSQILSTLPGRLPLTNPGGSVLPYLDQVAHLVSVNSRIRMLTWHVYALNDCNTDPTSPSYPTLANLLALGASRNQLAGLAPYIALAHHYGHSFRIDEMNSVSCNGERGVSNTFASALWITDMLFFIASQGIDGVNVHTFPQLANGLFDFGYHDGHWTGVVHPLYYGVLMFARAAPAGSHLLQIPGGVQGTVRAWATLAPDLSVRVLLINDSVTSAATTSVRVPIRAVPGSVQILRAPSVTATTGVTLGGQSFGPTTSSGVLPAPVQSQVRARGGAYALTVPPASELLLTVPGPPTSPYATR
jgi:hypothetical protein